MHHQHPRKELQTAWTLNQQGKERHHDTEGVAKAAVQMVAVQRLPNSEGVQVPGHPHVRRREDQTGPEAQERSQGRAEAEGVADPKHWTGRKGAHAVMELAIQEQMELWPPTHQHHGQ